MALAKAGSEIPKNAVIVNERDAIAYQWKQILDWPKKLDVWAYHFGLLAIAGSVTTSAYYITSYHRNKLKLRNFGYMTTMFAGMVAPALGSAIVHVEFVTNQILILKTPCSPCLHMKASLLQAAAGIVHPLIFSPIACTMVAINSGIRVPYYRETAKLFNMWKNIMKPMTGTILFLLSIQLLITNIVTHFEAQQFYELQEKFLAYDRKQRKEVH